MKSFKDKMYNYEVTPPVQNWQLISNALDKEEDTDVVYPKDNKIIYFRLAAASVAIIVISLLFWFVTSSKRNEFTAKQSLQINNAADIKNANVRVSDAKITVPATNEEGNNATDNISKLKNDEIVRATKPEALPKKYITISGPEGQPVKISTKAASLIVSSDDNYPPNTIWDDKVKKWKDIMKANTLAPTTANFLDIVELTHALRIKNP